jgi:signal transduction histidine kinase
VDTEPAGDVDSRVARYTRGSNLEWASTVLKADRDEILARWLTVAADQPFHRARPERAVADDIPRLFDALTNLLTAYALPSVDPPAPLDSESIQEAARGHSLARVEQGLQPQDVLVEFRLLRQEIGRALRNAVPAEAPTADIVSAELMLNDALDGAAAIALTALTERLEAMREEFIATTVHEVRQPITKISGFAQLAERLLDRPGTDPQRVREALRQIHAASSHMTALLETLVDSSQSALGGLVLQRHHVDLAVLLSDVIHGLEPAVAHRVALDLPPEGSANGTFDAVRMSQVMNNLIGNAAKYSPSDSTVEVVLHTNGDRATISVHDEGIGVAKEDLPRLFSRYIRAANAAHHAPGLGLGLYLSRAIVDAHGGRIWAESPGLDRGTTAFVELPLDGT